MNKKREVTIGIIALFLGLLVGFFSGQEYLKYKIGKNISYFAGQITGIFGAAKKTKSTAKKEPINESQEKIIPKKEVQFDPSRMSNEGYLTTKWGMTKQEVKDMIGAKFNDEGDAINYEDNVANEKAIVIFYFTQDKLYNVIVGLLLDTTNNEKYIYKYSELEDLLIDKYGKPKEKIKRGSKNPYISDSMAISLGEGFYRSIWETPESKILLILSGDKAKMRLGIYYLSKKYYSLAEQEKKQKIKGKL
jgi:uncharacterized protein YneF (UPF0154 family)